MQASLEEMQKWWAAVEQRQAIIKSVIDVSTDIILTLDRHGKIVEFNHVAEEAFGRKKQDVVNLPATDIIKTEWFASELSKLFSSPLEPNDRRFTGETTTVEITGEKGRLFSADITISCIRTGDEIVYPVYIRDLTAKLEGEQKLEKTRAQANQSAKMASLGEMAGGIAHEINTPLNIFTMCAEMLRESADDETIDAAAVADAANTIEETALRISKIIQGLKSFSRDDSHDDLTLCSVTSVVNDTLALCKQRFTSKGVKIRIGEIPAHWVVMGRPTSLSQVVLNLMNNSYDAIESLPERWIELSARENEEFYIVSVVDSGSGIRPDVVKRLMEPFFTTKGIGKGTGLGLSLSKGIVEHHGGALIYDSECKNTKFEIRLPKSIINKMAV